MVFMAFHNFSHQKNPNTFRRKEGSRFDELNMEEHHMNPFTMIFLLHSIFTSALTLNCLSVYSKLYFHHYVSFPQTENSNLASNLCCRQLPLLLPAFSPLFSLLF
ncbi:hypothetical protein NE237_027352 [Protea cynaroides]|uniref:Transmembrane protein n=1 Tax=Protea cynaroides TaxID=273540 RepID=A0A9Q0GN94_9MAGN|nr:hypothetical protein NE237_027352 [Protea cynaroides]